LAWRSLAAAAAGLSTRVSYTLFFFATAESPTIQLFYSLNVVGLRARSKSLHARSRSLRPDQTVFFTGLVAKGACSTVVRLLGSRRNRRFWMPKTL
jgi:hypothetical protein